MGIYSLIMHARRRRVKPFWQERGKRSMEEVEKMRYDSPFGPLLLEADKSGIRSLRLMEAGGAACPDTACALLRQAEKALDRYFAGEAGSFDLPISAAGSPFEQAVWAQLREIPYGETRTYGQIAARLGMPGAAQAVGRACGANPLLILTPCHRVIGAGGKLTGFAAGIEAKRALLVLEGHDIKSGRVIRQGNPKMNRK